MTDAKTTTVKSQGVTDSNNTAHTSTEKIAVTTKSYSITKALASKFVPEPESEEEDAEDEPEPESEEEEKPPTKGSKKVKKITGSKSATQAPVSKSTKQRTSKGQTQDAPEPESKSRKTATGKVPVLKYVKGKFNPNVKIREHMDQYQNKSDIPNIGQSIMNNNRELIRAAVIGSTKLYQSVLKTKKKIYTLNPKWCVDNDLNPLRIAMLNKDTKMIEAILTSMDISDKNKDKTEFTVKPRSMIERIETGFNDKYAYGVATRIVQMSRGNKQGNNAFTFDNYHPGNNVHYNDYNWMMSNNKVSLKEIEQVVSFNPDSRHNFLRGVQQAILAGNCEKAEHFIAENLKRDEYTFNKFHRLALIAKNVKDLEDIGKRNVTK